MIAGRSSSWNGLGTLGISLRKFGTKFLGWEMTSNHFPRVSKGTNGPWVPIARGLNLPNFLKDVLNFLKDVSRVPRSIPR